MASTLASAPCPVGLPQRRAAVTTKRRATRRASAAGAAEDCFSCQKWKTKCDRKRPYCGECIGLGKECTGYRTRLTWGVGVASRGKLRGLSLPIPVKAQQAATSAANSNSKRPSRAHPPLGDKRAVAGAENAQLSLPTVSERATATPAFCQPATSLDTTVPLSESGVDVCPSESIQDFYGFRQSSHVPANVHPRRPSMLQRLHTTIGFACESNSSPSTGSLKTPSDDGYSSVGGLLTPDVGPFDDPFATSPTGCYPADAIGFSPGGQLLGYPVMKANAGPLHSLHPGKPKLTNSSYCGLISTPCVTGLGTVVKMEDAVDARQNLINDRSGYCTSSAVGTPSDPCNDEQPFEDGFAGALLSPQLSYPFHSTGFLDMPPRMLQLLDYYDKAICPVLVAMDGPTNPYRRHIITLAFQSKGLQNAIAALAINNMRMRRSRRFSCRAWELDAALDDSEDVTSAEGGPGPEEAHLKLISVEQLNTQLANAVTARNDSVLATLLILCLFHICDSGFSKFKVLLQGVQKLLHMRENDPRSEFVGWVEMFFSWLDVMTSTVNDRETEIGDRSLSVMNHYPTHSCLEHFSGCDERLFKIIARLGRLNLLSQNKPVRTEANMPRQTYGPQLPSPVMTDCHNFRFDQLDGNPWAPELTCTAPALNATRDTRFEFWCEWHDIRARLQAWELPFPSPSISWASSTGSPFFCGDSHMSSMPSPLTSQAQDHLHISELFRYAALLYVERLAHPNVLPSSIDFQSYVARAVFHIRQLAEDSCVNKFLLWPLFIVGTECVSQADRDVIRSRCQGIWRESGFWNNLRGLEVLEKVWRDVDRECEGTDRNVELSGDGLLAGEQGRQRRQPFRWRRAMERSDGEYLMI